MRSSLKTLSSILLLATVAPACSDTAASVTCDAAHTEDVVGDVAVDTANDTAQDVASDADARVDVVDATTDVADAATDGGDASTDVAMDATDVTDAVTEAGTDAASEAVADAGDAGPTRCPACSGDGCTIVEVSTGARYSCARRASGEVLCWGDNTLGQLGDGTTTSSSRPVSVLGLCDAVEIEAGSGSACARRRSGQVSCWGWNGSGELGTGRTSADLRNSTTPLDAMGLDDAVAIDGGSGFFCAVRRSGRVSCWGTNRAQQLGDGSTVTGSATPVNVSGIFDASQVAAAQSACALRVGGQVVCWGVNYRGRLGTGTADNAPLPAMMVGVSDAVGVGASVWHGCVVRASGAVACAGDNAVGELGTAASADPVLTATLVPGVTGAVDVATGYRFSCALLRDGTVTCWGKNDLGELGRGSTSPFAEAGAVPGLTDVVQVTAHGPQDGATEGGHACALRRNGEVYCWGKNDLGQLGDGSTTQRASPVRVVFTAP